MHKQILIVAVTMVLVMPDFLHMHGMDYTIIEPTATGFIPEVRAL